MSDYYDTLTYGTNNPFIGSKLKLKRAKRHLRELEWAARELPVREGYQFILPAEPKAGKHQIFWMPSRPMPGEFAATVGDAIHNLRSALDFIAIALTVPPIGTGNVKRTYFPTGKDRKSFIEARDGFISTKGNRVQGKMEGAPSDALKLIEELEPYSGGKNSIRELHDLDILDKHKLIVPTISRMRVENLKVTSGSHFILLGATNFQTDAEGNRLGATVEIPFDDFKLDNNFQASFTIVFGKGQPLEGKTIIETLSYIADIGERFIQQCEALFLRTN